MTERTDVARVWLIRPKHLIWLLVLAATGASLWLFGTPHLVFTYRYIEVRDKRHYIWCDYVGQYSQRVKAVNGNCPLIRFLKAPGEDHS